MIRVLGQHAQKLMTIARTMNAFVTGMKDATSGSMMSFSDCGEINKKMCEQEKHAVGEMQKAVLCLACSQSANFPENNMQLSLEV